MGNKQGKKFQKKDLQRGRHGLKKKVDVEIIKLNILGKNYEFEKTHLEEISEYFSKQISRGKPIIINDFDEQDIEILCHYLGHTRDPLLDNYKRHIIVLTFQNVFQILSIAIKFEFKYLEDSCINFIQILFKKLNRDAIVKQMAVKDIIKNDGYFYTKHMLNKWLIKLFEQAESLYQAQYVLSIYIYSDGNPDPPENVQMANDVCALGMRIVELQVDNLELENDYIGNYGVKLLIPALVHHRIIQKLNLSIQLNTH